MVGRRPTRALTPALHQTASAVLTRRRTYESLAAGIQPHMTPRVLRAQRRGSDSGTDWRGCRPILANEQVNTAFPGTLQHANSNL